MGLTMGQRRSWARRGAAEINRVVAEGKAQVAALEAERDAERRAKVQDLRDAEAARVRLTHAEVVGAAFVRDEFGWHRVVRVNAKSVTVETAYSWTDRIELDRIREIRRGEQAAS